MIAVVICFTVFAYSISLRRRIWYYFPVYFVGFALILLNAWSLQNDYGMAFVGSDAAYLYELSKSISDKRVTWASLDSRYLGYAVYQSLVSYPFVDAAIVASILVKLSGWSLYVAAVSALDQSIRVRFLSPNSFYFLGISLLLLSGLTLAQFNFRDVLIATIIILIAAQFLSDSRFRLPAISALLFLMLFFRFFYVPMILVAYFVAKLTPYKYGFGRLKFAGFWLILPLILTTFIAGFLFSGFISAYLLNDGVGFMSRSYTLAGSGQSSLLSILKGFWASNPLIFFKDYFVLDAVDRTFVITSTSASLFVLLFSANFVLYISLLIVFIRPNIVTRMIANCSQCTSVDRKRIYIMVYTIILFVLQANMLYSLAFGGIQERHRAVFLALVAIVFSITNGFGVVTNRMIYTFIISVSLVLLGYLIG